VLKTTSKMNLRHSSNIDSGGGWSPLPRPSTSDALAFQIASRLSTIHHQHLPQPRTPSQPHRIPNPTHLTTLHIIHNGVQTQALIRRQSPLHLQLRRLHLDPGIPLSNAPTRPRNGDGSRHCLYIRKPLSVQLRFREAELGTPSHAYREQRYGKSDTEEVQGQSAR
jgi:hypothetical protein